MHGSHNFAVFALHKDNGRVSQVERLSEEPATYGSCLQEMRRLNRMTDRKVVKHEVGLFETFSIAGVRVTTLPL
jgi:hypothetical protein